MSLIERSSSVRDVPTVFGAGGVGLGLDVAMAVAILLTLYAVALTCYQRAIFKANATEAILATTTLQHDLIEHFAVTGDWIDSNAGRNVVGENVPRNPKDKSTRAEIVDSVIIASGFYRAHNDISIISVRPAVAAGTEHPTVMWLCGHAPTPAGWQSPTPVSSTNLPDQLLYSICRRQKPK